MIEPFPWLEPVWLQLIGGIRAGRISHAVLLHGAAGVGKLQLARCLAASLLCESASGKGACWQCRSCRQLFEMIQPDREGGHPDYIEMEAEDGSYQIDSIRAIADKLSLTHHSNKHQVVVLPRAELMNKHAANALLRTLEEPPRGCFFILTADERTRIIATVRSRLSQFHCRASLSRQALRQWLDGQCPDTGLSEAQFDLLHVLCGQAPLRMVELIEERALDEIETFYALFDERLSAAEFHGKLASWASKDKVGDAIEWLLLLVQSQTLALQGSQAQASVLTNLPAKWRELEPEKLRLLLEKLHELCLKIDSSRALLARKQYHSQIIQTHMLEFRSLLSIA